MSPIFWFPWCFSSRISTKNDRLASWLWFHFVCDVLLTLQGRIFCNQPEVNMRLQNGKILDLKIHNLNRKCLSIKVTLSKSNFTFFQVFSAILSKFQNYIPPCHFNNPRCLCCSTIFCDSAELETALRGNFRHTAVVTRHADPVTRGVTRSRSVTRVTWPLPHLETQSFLTFLKSCPSIRTMNVGFHLFWFPLFSRYVLLKTTLIFGFLLFFYSVFCFLLHPIRIHQGKKQAIGCFECRDIIEIIKFDRSISK